MEHSKTKRNANRDIERGKQGTQIEKNGREGYKETEKVTERKTETERVYPIK